MERERRRLAAIVAADVVGYSRLMGRDEAGTLAALNAARRDIVDPRIAQHGGRIVKTTGDGLLLEFPSVVDAVRCVVAVQEAVRAHGAGLPEDRRIVFRVGVHLGDVIVEGDDIFGDGVNIAARLEGIAEPGGACLSDDAYRQILGKIESGFDSLGPQTLKNIVQPVTAWRLRLGGANALAAAPTTAPLALPDKPSIAVLPFVNMSGDPEQEYFADGMVEDIITALSRFKSLFVIARNSSFSYKGKSPDIRQVGRELGVRYVLEGSVRKAGGRVRITGQLIQAESGAHVWADRYDGDLGDIFALQDHITESVVGAVAPSIERAEIERARRKPPGSLDAYELYLRALPYFYDMSRSGNTEAIRLLRHIVTVDPGYPAPAYMLASCLTWGVAQGWFSVAEVGAEAVRYAESAVRSDKDNPEAIAILARIAAYIDGRHADAVTLAERAVTLNENSFTAWSLAGWVNVYAGQSESAVEYFQKALRLSPRDPMDFDALAGLGIALIQLGKRDAAIAVARRSTQRNPNYTTAWRALAAAAALNGDLTGARTSVQHLLRLDPGFSLAALEARSSFSEQARARYFEGLRLAGLPE